jgi:pyridoxine 4-dehydrogenase
LPGGGIRMTTIIRSATPADAEAIAGVHVRAWQAAYRGLMPQDFLDQIDLGARIARWHEILGTGMSTVVVAETAAGALLGFAGVGPTRDEDLDRAHIGEVAAIYLDPARWGRGTGRQLMAAATSRLAADGFSEARLWVLDSNARARRFYEAGGWIPDGATKIDDTRGFPLTEVRYRIALPPHASRAGTWRLGDLTVNRLGFGAMRLTGHSNGSPSDRDQAIAVLRRAVELGVNHIDTAAFYFSPLRSANELINRALAPYPDDLVIATKVWPGRDPSGEWYWAAPDQLRSQVEENLRQLGRDHLDLVNLRIPRSHQAGSLAEHFGALAGLRDKGLIRHLGVSNVTPAQLAEALAIAPVVCVQNRYGIGATAAEHEFVDACGAQGIAYTPWFAIADGGGEAAAVEAVATAHGISPAQVRLAWTLQRGPHVLAIPGTGSPEHLIANIGTAALRLTAAEVTDLATT